MYLEQQQGEGRQDALACGSGTRLSTPLPLLPDPAAAVGLVPRAVGVGSVFTFCVCSPSCRT